MIAVIQRCRKASVSVGGNIVGVISHGLVVLLGVFSEDSEKDAQFLAGKITEMRIFNDCNGKMNLSLKDVKGEVLSISQFTLCGDWRKGRRPGFIKAARPEKGKALYQYFNEEIRKLGFKCEEGVFGAMMDVSLVNEGPVTFVLDSKLK